MDMKKILQAIDGVSTKPVEGASDMSKFVQIVNEGANPHKVALPVQMAMQHYSKPVEKKQPKQSVISKYFTEAEEAIVHRQVYKTVEIQEKASRIVERLRLKESALLDKEDLKAKRKALQDIQLDPHTHKDPELKAELTRRKADLEKEAKHKGLSEGEAGWNRTGMAGVGLQANESPIEMDPTEPNNPLIHSHQKANPMQLKSRIVQARNQLRELADMAESDELIVWEKITRLSKGGMFMGLEQNLEQIRHGIAELSKKRTKGGISSRGIDKGIGEQGMADTVTSKLVSAGASARKAVDNAVGSIPRPFDEREVANDLAKQKK